VDDINRDLRSVGETMFSAQNEILHHDVPVSYNIADEQFMARALELAHSAYALNEVPVGAVLVHDGKIIGEGFNQPISLNDPCAHAEILALRHAATTLENYRLINTTLYVTLEPCAMCVGAMIHARVQRLVFSAKDPKTGAVCSAVKLIDAEFFNHRIIWEQGACAGESAKLLQKFFQQRRKVTGQRENCELP
jgi:tRNA(adenine34) deaminase